MFERYDLDTLFLADIDITFPNHSYFKTDMNGDSEERLSECSYTTIIRKIDDHYIDLAHPEIKISQFKSTRITTYTVGYKEPLSNYYTQDGKSKQTFSRRKALKEGKKHYMEFYQKRLKLIKEN